MKYEHVSDSGERLRQITYEDQKKDMTELPDRLRALRMTRGLTQEELAASAGIKYHTYRKYEMGKTKPSVDHLIALADFHHCTTDYLLGRETLQ